MSPKKETKKKKGRTSPKKGKANPMRQVRLGKLIINMGVGEAGPKLEKSENCGPIVITGHRSDAPAMDFRKD